MKHKFKNGKFIKLKKRIIFQNSLNLVMKANSEHQRETFMSVFKELNAAAK